MHLRSASLPHGQTRAPSRRLYLALTAAHERILHYAHRHELAANIDLHPVGRARGHARERDCLAARRRERTGEYLAVALRRDHALAVTQPTLFVHHEPDQHALDPVDPLLYEHTTADKRAPALQRPRPGDA